jgi:hypothetical protein
MPEKQPVSHGILTPTLKEWFSQLAHDILARIQR